MLQRSGATLDNTVSSEDEELIESLAVEVGGKANENTNIIMRAVSGDICCVLLIYGTF